MRKLEFTGTVRASKEKIVLPGRDALFLKPEDWPSKLSPGSLTLDLNEKDTLKHPASPTFRPARVAPARHIIGSPLQPDSDHPTRGFASVWRAELHVVATGRAGKCWMFR